jgi:hypothetical protein
MVLFDQGYWNLVGYSLELLEAIMSSNCWFEPWELVVQHISWTLIKCYDKIDRVEYACKRVPHIYGLGYQNWVHLFLTQTANFFNLIKCKFL